MWHRLLELCGFKLPAHKVKELVAAADVNGDGLIEYSEFIPLGAALMQEATKRLPAALAAPTPPNDGLEGFTFEQLKEFARRRGVKKANQPWSACCPPAGIDYEGERRGPDSCAKQDIIAALRKQKGHVSNYWNRDSFGQFQAGGPVKRRTAPYGMPVGGPA